MAWTNETARKGLTSMSNDKLTQLLIGTARHEVLNCAAANATPSEIDNCRQIYCDGAGIIKFDYVDDNDQQTYTEVMYVVAGIPRAVRNVSKVYRYYTGTTACTATVYNDAGTLVAGMKLRR